MGNTILAHALYACNKIDIDLKNLFSKTGNAHKISGVNCTDLYAAHLVEAPVENSNCVIEVKCNDWSELLRIKFSYSKWYQDEPKLSNFEKFFTYRPKDNSDDLWQQFYTTFKDPSWPDCETFEQLIFLPDHIQSEILSVYTPPNRVIVSDTDLAEYLTQCYYDHLAKQMFRTKKILQVLRFYFYKITSTATQISYSRSVKLHLDGAGKTQDLVNFIRP